MDQGQTQSDEQRRKARRCLRGDRSQNDNEKKRRQHDFRDQHGGQLKSLRRCLGVTIGSKSADARKLRRSRRDEVENTGGQNCTDDLSRPIGQKIACFKSAPQHQTQRDCRVK